MSPRTPLPRVGQVEIRAGRFSKSIPAHQIVLALALVLTFIAYCGSIRYPFVHDDKLQILQEPSVRSWSFAPGYFAQALQGKAPGVRGSYYRPLFLVWFRINHMLFGYRAWGWHLMGILAHLSVTLAVYFLAVRLLIDRTTAAVASLIFGLYPVHIEAVAWVSGLMDTLASLLFISSFLCYLRLRGDKSHAKRWRAASLLLYLGAMLMKETALVLPLIVFAYAWIFCGVGAWVPRVTKRVQRVLLSLREASLYLTATLVYLVARTVALRGFLHPVHPLGLSTVILTWPSVMMFCLRLFIWPVGLSPFYSLPYVTRPGFTNFVLPIVWVSSAAALLWAWARRPANRLQELPHGTKSQVIGFASVWILAPMIPLLGLAFIPGGAFAHDRFLYLPSVGVALMAGLALRSKFSRQTVRQGRPLLQNLLVGGISLLFLIGTVTQSAVWADDLVIYSKGLQVDPNSNELKNDLANVLAERGRAAEALELYEEVLSRDPNHPVANYNLGYLDYRLGKANEAERYLKRAVAVEPTNAAGFLYLGLAELRIGRLDEAETALRRAVAMEPQGQGVHFALGMVLKLKGDLDAALKEFRLELAADPQNKTVQEQVLEIERNQREF